MKRQLGEPPPKGQAAINTHPLHGSGDEDAPPIPQGLLLPGALGQPRSLKPPERARVRASARLGPPGPSRARVRFTHTSLGGGNRVSHRPMAAVLLPEAQCKSGPRNQTA